MNIFLSIVSSLIIFTCSLLAAFLLAVKSQNHAANRHFALFLILTAIDAGGWLIATVGLSDSWWNAIRFASVFLQMPFFLWFVQTACFTDFRYSRWDSLHFLPFVIAVILTMPGEQLAFGTAPQPQTAAFLTNREIPFFIAAAHIQYYAYIASSIRILVEFRRIFHEHCPGVKSSLFKWLTQLVAVSVIVHSLVLFKSILAFTTFEPLFLLIQPLGALVTLGVITWFSLKALLQPELFRGVDKGLLRARRFARGDEPPAQKEVETLLSHMKTERPYLDPALTVSDLAKQLKTTPRNLSELINQNLGVSFFDFVNRYRIDFAKDLLRDKSKTVLEILYAAGFNSKSSFNTAFKKHSNMTPSLYRRSVLPSETLNKP